MGRYIIHHDGWFLEWSTVVDAPVTYGMRRQEFDDYYRKEYGEEGMRGLPARMSRALRKGTSSLEDDSAEDTVFINRAGYRETKLTLPEIIRIYCEEQRSPNPGEGVDLDEEDAA